MSETYAKLFSSILRSSIWAEPLETKIVWITMLALSDRYGYVGASIPGIAQASGVPVQKAAEAIERFLAPDEWSRSKEFDGRRIEVADRGWTILNYERFRDMRDEEARREYERDRKREQRAKQAEERDGHTADVTGRDTQGQSGTVPQGPGQKVENDDCPAMSAHAEASAAAASSPSGEVQKRPPRAGALGVYEEGFQAFWQAYGHKIGKHAAEKAWASLKPTGAVLEAIVAKARATSDANPSREFYKHPATWLNGRHWQDEVIPTRGGATKRRVADGGDWTGNSEPIQEI